MEYRKACEAITEQYAEKLLGWAINKTFSREKGEELAQDVFCAIFSALLKSPEIENLNAYIWRIAHYTWCNSARIHRKDRVVIGFDESLLEMNDPDNDIEMLEDQLALRDELQKMRRELANLNRLQRECMILYYLDGLSLTQVAIKLKATESAVKWHLFDARNKLKKEIKVMDKDNQKIYRPGRLGVALSGTFNTPWSECDTAVVERSLIKQNICLLCYREPKTIDQIAEDTGIPKPYFEEDLNWLAEHDFLKKNGARYSTDFVVYSRRTSQRNLGVFAETRSKYIDVMLDFLVKNKQAIRDIGFYGSDLPYDRLLWPLIMIFTGKLKSHSPAFAASIKGHEYPLRKDGGKYEPLGFNQSPDQTAEPDPNGFKALDGWDGINGPMTSHYDDSGTGYWMGIASILGGGSFDYIGDRDKFGDVIGLYCACIKFKGEFLTGGLLPDKEKEHLALAVERGWIKKIGNSYAPQFPIFSAVQFDRLIDLFKPMYEAIEPVTAEVINAIKSVFIKDAPPLIKNRAGFVVSNLFGWLDFMMMMFAYEKGLLNVPDDLDQKRITTLLLVDMKK